MKYIEEIQLIDILDSYNRDEISHNEVLDLVNKTVHSNLGLKSKDYLIQKLNEKGLYLVEDDTNTHDSESVIIGIGRVNDLEWIKQFGMYGFYMDCNRMYRDLIKMFKRGEFDHLLTKV